MSTLVQLRRHVTRLRGCTDCPDMIRPVVTGNPVMSPVMLIGQAPGIKEGPAGKPFAWTAGKTLFGWFASVGLTEEQFRDRVYMAAVARCFPGKAPSGGDRVPSPDEVKRCSRHMETEVRLLRPRLVIPVGKLAIAQLYPEIDKLTEIIGTGGRGTIAGHEFDVIALPHPSGASTWHRTEPGKTLLARALALLSRHEAWRALVAMDDAASSPNAALSNAASSKATPSKATPSKATPSNAMPSNAALSNAASSKATPSKAMPSKATPSKATPSNANSEDAGARVSTLGARQ